MGVSETALPLMDRCLPSKLIIEMTILSVYNGK